MKNHHQSPATPLLVEACVLCTHTTGSDSKMETPTLPGGFCSSAFSLGIIVGMLSQMNSLSTSFIVYLFQHVENPLWMSCAYAGATAAQLLVFLVLLRAIATGEKRLYDLDRWFGLGSIVGVSFAWMLLVHGTEFPILVVMSVSLTVFQCLMWWIYTSEFPQEKDKGETKDRSAAEYQLLVV